jgi:hypothetical protein
MARGSASHLLSEGRNEVSGFWVATPLVYRVLRRALVSIATLK